MWKGASCERTWGYGKRGRRQGTRPGLGLASGPQDGGGWKLARQRTTLKQVPIPHRKLVPPGDILGGKHSGRRTSKCKDPLAETYVISSRKKNRGSQKQ